MHILVPIFCLLASIGLIIGSFKMMDKIIYHEAKTAEECTKITLEDCKGKECCGAWDEDLKKCYKGKQENGMCKVQEPMPFVLLILGVAFAIAFAITIVMYFLQK